MIPVTTSPERGWGVKAPALSWEACRAAMLLGAGAAMAGIGLLALPFWPLLLAALLAVAYARFRTWSPGFSSHGTAAWATTSAVAAKGLFAGEGIPLGRMLSGGSGKWGALETLADKHVGAEEACRIVAQAWGEGGAGQLVRLPVFTHLICLAPTGSGKGVSYVIPTLLTYRRGSVITHDPKFDNYKATQARRRALGDQVVLLDPFGESGERRKDGLNPLDFLDRGPLLFDQARSLADAMVPKMGTEPDPHWVESATAVLAALIVLVVLRFPEKEQNLNTVCELAANVTFFDVAAKKLLEIGGIAGRMGGHLAGLMDREKASVLSTTNRALACFSSGPVADFLSKTTFDADALLRPGLSLYYGLPVQFLDSHRGLLRLITSTLLLRVLQKGDERSAETLWLLDECATLAGLDSLAQALVLGRAKGIRLFTFWQTADQARRAFKDKEDLVFANSATQIWFAVNSYESAERLSKVLGDATLVIENYQKSDGSSWQEQGPQANQKGRNEGSSRSYSQMSRPLLRPEEVLQRPLDEAVVVHQGLRPLRLRRSRYFDDPAFTESGGGDALARAWGIAFVFLLVGAGALGAALAALGCFDDVRW
jgi:type IV secretion system protein VirD4